MGKMISEKKLVRAHGLRAKDQVKRDDIWWMVERQVNPGSKITIVMRVGNDKIVDVPKDGVSILAARGSRKEVFTFQPNTILNVIRPRVKVGT